MSKIVIRTCKHHGLTEFYSYDSGDVCRSCVLARRKKRRDNLVLNAKDYKTTREWIKNNPNKVKTYNQSHIDKRDDKMLSIKTQVYQDNLDLIKYLFDNYRSRKDFKGKELFEQFLKVNKTFKEKFDIFMFTDRMLNKIYQNKYMNASVVIKSKKGYIRMENGKILNTYATDATEAGKAIVTRLAKREAVKKRKEVEKGISKFSIITI